MPLNSPDIKELKAIVDWVNLTEDVRELSLKYGDVELFISRNRHSAVPAAPSAVSVPAISSPTAVSSGEVLSIAPEVPPQAVAVPSGDMVLAPNEVLVKAPMVGTFYEASKPGAPAFVEVGTKVEPGTVLCIVEVMKLMNNVEASEVGTVTKILVENNQAVAFGQPLMVITRDA